MSDVLTPVRTPRKDLPTMHYTTFVTSRRKAYRALSRAIIFAAFSIILLGAMHQCIMGWFTCLEIHNAVSNSGALLILWLLVIATASLAYLFWHCWMCVWRNWHDWTS